MPRSVINLIGVVVTIGVLLLALFLVAMPIAFQALGVVGQTVTVANTNAIYQAEVDALREEEARLDEVEASVAGLHTQITPANELDDVFELVAKSAESSGVSIVSIAAGEQIAFVERTSATSADELVQPSAAPTQDQATNDATATPAPSDGNAAGTPNGVTDAATPPIGRTQIDFSVTVTASELDQVVQFLDGLRAGPRLLGQIQSTVSPTGTGFDVILTALTFVLPEEG